MSGGAPLGILLGKLDGKFVHGADLKIGSEQPQVAREKLR